MRTYRPFLVFNPKRGWGFYQHSGVSSLTTRSMGNHRKAMRPIVGWFQSAHLAASFAKRGHFL